MKKVFFFSTLESVTWGGSEQLWSDVVMHIQNKGHDIITNTIFWPDTPPVLKKIEQLGGKLTVRPNTHISAGTVYKLKNKINALKWKNQVRSFNPDIILISAGGAFDNAILQHGEWLLSLNKPIFIVCQYLLEYEYMEPERRTFFTNFFKQTSHIFFVSERNKEVAEKTLATNFNNASIIRNPIKITEAPTSYPTEEIYYMAVVARLELPVKGFDILADVLSQPQWQKRNLHINIYGTGLHESFIKQLFSHCELNDIVTFHGYTEDVKSIWDKNHIMLLPSRGEGTPLSLLEAGFCKRAAIVTDVGGNAEIIVNGLNGFVADAPVVKCLAETMEHAWQKRTEWKQMGYNAREVIDKLYDKNPVEELALRLTS